MEKLVKLRIEFLPEGVYLATTDDIPGLVAQGRTIQETLEIARDLAKKLVEYHQGLMDTLEPASETFDYALVLGV